MAGAPGCPGALMLIRKNSVSVDAGLGQKQGQGMNSPDPFFFFFGFLWVRRRSWTSGD
jgi:hypothetical protein